MALALSTSWNAFRHTIGKELLLEILSLGFRHIELSFNLTPAILEEIEKEAQRAGVKVTSVHNYCPVPNGLKPGEALPDCYSLVSLDNTERQTALKFTKASIDTAARLDAGAVVLHCGRVEVADRTKELIRLREQGAGESEEFKDIQRKAVEEREQNSRPFLDNALKSLDELNAYAGQKGVSLGIETRFYYREIPSLAETAFILDKFRGSKLGYWHDTGHAQVMENLGFAKHREYLAAMGKDMIGVHLHNVSGCSDHRAPSRGDIDFSLLLPYLKEETLKVIEAHHPAAAGELKQSKQALEALFDGKI